MTTRNDRGFTLFELSLVLMIVLLMAGTVPYALREVENQRFRRAQNDAVAMVNGIFGSRDMNGMIGDLGYIPPGTLHELARGRSDFAMRSNERGVTYGWNGPYALPGVLVGPAADDGITRDPWGNMWVLETATGTLFSPGANGMVGGVGGMASDDIRIPEVPRQSTVGSLHVFAYDPDGQPLNSDQAVIEVAVPAVNGITRPTCGAPWTGGVCTMANIPHGQRVVTLKGVSGTRWENWRGYSRVFIAGGSRSTTVVKLTHWLETP